MGIVRFALRYPHTFYVVAALILFLGVTAAVDMTTDIFPEINIPGTRTLLTEIDVPNPNRDLAAGVYCIVELKIPRPSPALVVPASAIIFNQNGMQVAVAENGVAHLCKIAIATDYGTEVEVSDGVTAGDMLILQPPVDLADGDKMQVAADPPHYP